MTSGVHAGAVKSPADEVCAAIQRHWTFELDASGSVRVHMRKDLGINGAAFDLKSTDDVIATDISGLSALDPVLVEVLGACLHLAKSPDVARLEEHIRAT